MTDARRMAAVVADVELLARFPRAPTEEEWARMSAAERARVVEALPAAMTELEFLPPEGDPHREVKVSVETTLREHFRRTGRNVYVASDLTVYYPGVARFAPDVQVVVDVEPHPRMKWVVSHEGRGLDVVFEVHVAGDRKKDLERNTELYARLGIPEYFLFDRGRCMLFGYRLAEPGARAYRRIVPQGGMYRCEVLGLDLAVEGERIRFYLGNAMLLDLPEIVARLEQLTAEATRRAEEEAQRAEEEARRAEELARRVAELEAELARRKA